MRLLAAVLIAALGVAAAAVAALAGGGADQVPRSVVQVTLGDDAIDAGTAPVRAGRVRVEALNRGSVEHDLLIVRTDRAAGDLPMGLEGPAPELAGEIVLGRPHRAHEHDARGSAPHHLAPGARRSRTVTLRPGRHVLICPLPGHYGAGQRTAIEVR